MGALSNMPHWPRMMRRTTAAKFLDLTEAEFEQEVATGRLPMPIKLGRGDRWSQAQLDDYLARLTGDAAPDWRKGAAHYAKR